jgi:hypothetical protein
LLSVWLLCPGTLPAQTTNKPAAKKPAVTAADPAKPEAKQPVAGPFHGKLVAIDQVAKTITVGKRTFQITSATKIKRAGQPAVLADGVVGETVSGYVKPTEDGKLFATTLNLGPKAAAKPETAKPAGPKKTTPQ